MSDPMKATEPPIYLESFDALLAQERATSRDEVPPASTEPTVGVALSAGPRAAGFGLGVLRALEELGRFRELRYLSAVGEGALGAAFVQWVRKSGHAPEPGQLVDAAALAFVRQHADPVIATPGARARSRLLAVTLAQAARSFYVYGALLIGLFLALHVGDALITLISPLMLLASRDDLFVRVVGQLNFASVAALCVLLAGAARSLWATFRARASLMWVAARPRGATPRRSDAWRGALWWLLGLLTGVLGLCALYLAPEQPAAIVGAAGMAALSVTAFRRCRARWTANGTTTPGAGAWLWLPLLCAVLGTAVALGLLGFVLLKAGQTGPGLPTRVPMWGATLALGVALACVVALVPRALRGLGRFASRLARPDVESLQHALAHAYAHERTRQRRAARTLWATFAWLSLATVPWASAALAGPLGGRPAVVATLVVGLAVGAVAVLLHVLRLDRPTRFAWLPTAAWALGIYAALIASHTLTGIVLDGGWPAATLWITASGALLGLLTHVNFTGPARFVRERIAEAFLPDARALRGQHATSARQAAVASLCELGAVGSGPQLLLQASLMDVGADGHAVPFQLSPLYCGSAETGWVRTSEWLRGRFSVRDALAVAAGDVVPGIRVHDGSAVVASWLSTAGRGLLNLRRGYWADHPQPARRSQRPWLHTNLVSPGLGQLLRGPGARTGDSSVRLREGALSDPLGLLALLGRRLDEIIVVDATEWRSGQPDILRRVARQAHQQLGVQLRLGPLDGAMDGPAPDRAVGTIVYPPSATEPGFEGTLVYLRATASNGADLCFFEDDILGHRLALEAFAEPVGRAVGHSMPVMKAHGAST